MPTPDRVGLRHRSVGSAPPEMPPPRAQQAPVQAPPEAQRNFLERQNPALILKLAIIVYILSQGGSYWRIAVLSFLAFVIYLYVSTHNLILLIRPPPG